MTISEITDLIKICKETGIRHYEGNGLKFDFGPSEPPPVVAAPNVADPAFEQRNLEEEEIRIRHTDLEEMKIRDPYMYEQLIAFDNGGIIP